MQQEIADNLRKLVAGWRGAGGEVVRSFATLTTVANATMRPLHERMPVILPPEAWPVWLGEGVGVAASWLRPAADDVLRLWPVSRAVNNVRNDGAHLLDPLGSAPDSQPAQAAPGSVSV